MMNSLVGLPTAVLSRFRIALISVAVVACMLAGICFPRSVSVFSGEKNDTARTLGARPILMQVFCFTKLPLRVVNDLFSGKTPETPQKTRNGGAGRENGEDACSGILPAGNGVRCAIQKCDAGKALLSAYPGPSSFMPAPGGRKHGGSPPGNHIAFIFLLLFLLLPRSNTAEDSVLAAVSKRYARLAR